jgi:hypothetical protein
VRETASGESWHNWGSSPSVEVLEDSTRFVFIQLQGFLRLMQSSDSIVLAMSDKLCDNSCSADILK